MLTSEPCFLAIAAISKWNEPPVFIGGFFFGRVLVAEDPFLVNALMAILVGSLMVPRKMEGRIVIWPWVNTNYHQNWVGEHPNKDYYNHFWDVHQGYRVLTHTHFRILKFPLTCGTGGTSAPASRPARTRGQRPKGEHGGYPVVL